MAMRASGRDELAVALLSSAARTTTGLSAAIEVGDRTTLRMVLDVAAVSGTSPTLDAAIETSRDGVSWMAIGAFARVADMGTWEASFGTAQRFIRVRWTIGGTGTPGFTFAVTGVALLVYCTREDVSRCGLGKLTTDTIDDSELQSTIVRRSGYGDDYTSRYYTLPLTAWSDGLRLAIAQLVAWDTICNIGFNPDGSTADVWMARRDEAQRYLEMIAKTGAAGIVDSTPDDDEGDGISAASDPMRGWNSRMW